MKIVYQGDIHIRDRAPINRIDDYWEAQFGKLAQLVNFANTHEATLMLGGDIFDTYKMSAAAVNRTIIELRRCAQKVYACLGQHDVPYHNMDLQKSPVYSLLAAGAINVVTIDNSCLIGDTEDICVHFHSWESQNCNSIGAEDFNILLGHISVFEGAVPFYWKGEGYTPKTLKEKYPGFDLYLCGDIHDPCVEGNVVVSGSMMRSAINQIDFRPRCYLIDTEDLRIEPLYYEIEQDVFSVVEQKETQELDLTNLVQAMKDASVGKESFTRGALAAAGDDQRVKSMIQEIFDEFSN